MFDTLEIWWGPEDKYRICTGFIDTMYHHVYTLADHQTACKDRLFLRVTSNNSGKMKRLVPANRRGG